MFLAIMIYNKYFKDIQQINTFGLVENKSNEILGTVGLLFYIPLVRNIFLLFNFNKNW